VFEGRFARKDGSYRMNLKILSLAQGLCIFNVVEGKIPRVSGCRFSYSK
jgi:hypothetical protein